MMWRRLLSVRVLAAVLILAAIVVGGWFWYRGSSLVAIRSVTVTGLSGPDVTQIRRTLTNTAKTMTTLDVNMPKLEAAVSQFPEVSSLTVTTHGAHSATIDVLEKIPLARISGGYVDESGGVLTPDATVHEQLPRLIESKSASDYADADGQISGHAALNVLKVLAAAPYSFLAHVSTARYTPAYGVVARLKNGPQVRFGGPGRAQQKWAAALQVLRSASSAGAGYIDVTDPQRPAAGP